MDNRESGKAGLDELVDIGAHFEKLSDVQAGFKDTWPRFRGAEFDNIKKSGVRLLDQFAGEVP